LERPMLWGGRYAYVANDILLQHLGERAPFPDGGVDLSNAWRVSPRISRRAPEVKYSAEGSDLLRIKTLIRNLNIEGRRLPGLTGPIAKTLDAGHRFGKDRLLNLLQIYEIRDTGVQIDVVRQRSDGTLYVERMGPHSKPIVEQETMWLANKKMLEILEDDDQVTHFTGRYRHLAPTEPTGLIKYSTGYEKRQQVQDLLQYRTNTLNANHKDFKHREFGQESFPVESRLRIRHILEMVITGVSIWVVFEMPDGSWPMALLAPTDKDVNRTFREMSMTNWKRNWWNLFEVWSEQYGEFIPVYIVDDALLEQLENANGRIFVPMGIPIDLMGVKPPTYQQIKIRRLG
jgi:hypothetical protein